MTDNVAVSAIDFLCEQYDKQLTDDQLDFWVEALADYTPETLRRATVSIVKQSKWMPKLAEVVDACEHEKFRDTDYNLSIYYNAMELLGANLRGDITDQQLETDSAWQWWQRHAVAADVPDSVLIESDAEVRRWMEEDALESNA